MHYSQSESRKRRTLPYRLAICLAIVLFLVVAPEVQGGKAMEPTIKDGDICVLYKLANYSAKRGAPEINTLVVLDKDISLDAGVEDNIITRVIAVPGDTVEIKNGELFVNDKPFKSKGGIKGATGNFAKKKLKGNQIFVLGDNRESAKAEKFDSRNPKLGLVDMRDIRGNVFMRVFPFSSFGLMMDK